MPRILVGLDFQPQFVTLTTVDGEVLIDGEFCIAPITGAMRKTWEQKHKVCRKCGGLGIIPLGQDSAAKCPVCRALPTAPTMDSPEVQQAIGAEICLGWRVVPTAGGPEYEFSDEHRDDLIAKFPELFWALIRAGNEIAQGRAKSQGKGSGR